MNKYSLYMHMLFIQDLQNHASSPLNKHNRTFGNWTFIHSLIEKGFHPDPHISRCSWDQKAAVLRVVNPSPSCAHGWLGLDVGLGRSMFHHPSLRIRLYVLRKSKKRISQNQSYDLGMGCFNQNQSYKKSEGVRILRSLCGICMKQLGWMFGELRKSLPST